MRKSILFLVLFTLVSLTSQSQTTKGNITKGTKPKITKTKSIITIAHLKSNKKTRFFSDKSGQIFLYDNGIVKAVKKGKKRNPPSPDYRPFCPGGTVQNSGYVATWTEDCPGREGYSRECQQIILTCRSEGSTSIVTGNKTCRACTKNNINGGGSVFDNILETL